MKFMLSMRHYNHAEVLLGCKRMACKLQKIFSDTETLRITAIPFKSDADVLALLVASELERLGIQAEFVDPLKETPDIFISSHACPINYDESYRGGGPYPVFKEDNFSIHLYPWSVR